MTRTYMRHVARALALSLTLSLQAFAQGGPGSQADLEELQAQYSAVQQRVAAARQADPALATRLEHELSLVGDYLEIFRCIQQSPDPFFAHDLLPERDAAIRRKIGPMLAMLVETGFLQEA